MAEAVSRLEEGTLLPEKVFKMRSKKQTSSLDPSAKESLVSC